MEILAQVRQGGKVPRRIIDAASVPEREFHPLDQCRDDLRVTSRRRLFAAYTLPTSWVPAAFTVGVVPATATLVDKEKKGASITPANNASLYKVTGSGLLNETVDGQHEITNLLDEALYGLTCHPSRERESVRLQHLEMLSRHL